MYRYIHGAWCRSSLSEALPLGLCGPEKGRLCFLWWPWKGPIDVASQALTPLENWCRRGISTEAVLSQSQWNAWCSSPLDRSASAGVLWSVSHSLSVYYSFSAASGRRKDVACLVDPGDGDLHRSGPVSPCRWRQQRNRRRYLADGLDPIVRRGEPSHWDVSPRQLLSCRVRQSWWRWLQRYQPLREIAATGLDRWRVKREAVDVASRQSL